MEAQTRYRLRITYVETGRLVLLSHLEVAGTLERVVRRAQLPYAISQGFSPHMKIAFGMALPVGIGSTCEMFEVQLTERVDPDEALARLQASTVPDLMILSCAYVEWKAPAASVAYPIATYDFYFSRPVENFEMPKTVFVTRKKKTKELTVSDFLVGDVQVDGECVTLSLESKPSGSLRVDKLAEAMLDSLNDAVVEGQEPYKIASITRVDQFAREEA